jgi:hypothetical protein
VAVTVEDAPILGPPPTVPPPPAPPEPVPPPAAALDPQPPPEHEAEENPGDGFVIADLPAPPTPTIIQVPIAATATSEPLGCEDAAMPYLEFLSLIIR